MDERPTRYFGSFAGDYDVGRPAAVPEALDWLLPDGDVDVVDVGAGTGLFTRLLVERGLRVVAVEPDERMLEVLKQQTPAVPTVLAAAEDMPLPDASADAVLAATAWHWFDPERAPLEIARVLRPGGRVGTVGTILDPELDWAGELIDFLLVDRGVPLPWNDVAAPAAGPFTTPERAEFRRSVQVDVETVMREVSAWAGVRRAEPYEREKLLEQARRIIGDRFPDGQVNATYRSLCFRSDRT